jgi:hypothetical protein
MTLSNTLSDSADTPQRPLTVNEKLQQFGKELSDLVDRYDIEVFAMAGFIVVNGVVHEKPFVLTSDVLEECGADTIRFLGDKIIGSAEMKDNVKDAE